MTRRAGDKYCAQHLMIEQQQFNGNDSELSESNGNVVIGRGCRKRVVCMIDPGHTVRESELRRHLLKCEKKRQLAREHLKMQTWFSKDVNLLQPSTSEGEAAPAAMAIQPLEYERVAAFVNSFYATHIANTRYEVPYISTSSPSPPSSQSPMPAYTKWIPHEGLARRMSELTNQKHAIQQGVLISALDFENLLSLRNYYIEFGAGRGELSRYMFHGLLYKYHNSLSTPVRILLIDRSGTRRKLDTKIAKDSYDIAGAHNCATPIVTRLKIDIKDLQLIEVNEQEEGKNVHDGDSDGGIVAISKHLCGAATDLTVQCLLNYERMRVLSPASQIEDTLQSQHTRHRDVKGILIALCCRQKCSYDSFPLQYLTDHARNPRDFEILVRMSSWALCGRRPVQKNRTTVDDNKQHKTEEEDEGESEDADCSSEDDEALVGSIHPSGLSISDREKLGMKVRAIIDFCRARNLEDQNIFTKVETIRYVNKHVSPENVCLLAVK
ncbi:methyltransferase TRM13-domain-containing protein [Limtongia smithiae]|uniref:methyltransferase TRM13-domain-containing protein n=1 Tax=Limtongia smithiae TaxID=1125753 RepID=UPI0034CF2757